MTRTVRYTMTRGDLLRFYVHHYGHSWGFMAVQIIFLAILCHSIYRGFPSDAPIITRTIVLAIFLLLGVAFLAILFFASIAFQLFTKKNRTMRTEHEITLKDESFVEKTQFNTTEHTWAAVQRLRRSKNYIFLYIAANLAHVIPKRAFAAEEEWNSFYEFCREKARIA